MVWKVSEHDHEGGPEVTDGSQAYLDLFSPNCRVEPMGKLCRLQDSFRHPVLLKLALTGMTDFVAHAGLPRGERGGFDARLLGPEGDHPPARNAFGRGGRWGYRPQDACARPLASRGGSRPRDRKIIVRSPAWPRPARGVTYRLRSLMEVVAVSTCNRSVSIENGRKVAIRH